MLGVVYTFEVPGHREWPVRLDDLYLFVRVINGRGTHIFEVDTLWLDGPEGEEEIGTYTDFQVQFADKEAIESRGFRVPGVRYPGPGHYQFRLREAGSKVILARENIRIRRLS